MKKLGLSAITLLTAQAYESKAPMLTEVTNEIGVQGSIDFLIISTIISLILMVRMDILFEISGK